MHAVELLTGPSLAIFKVINWAKFVFKRTLFVRKHYKIEVSAHFLIKRKLRAQIFKVINWAKLAFFGPQTCAQLITLTWPVNNFEKMVFYVFLLLKCADILIL